MNSTARVFAEILPTGCIQNEKTGQTDWHFHYRGMDMVNRNNYLRFDISAEELGSVFDFLAGTALITKIEFTYTTTFSQQ